MEKERDPRDVLRAWLDDNERSIAWAARQIGWTREQLSRVVNKQRPMSAKLAIALRDTLGIAVDGPAHTDKRTGNGQSG
jgi:plasmid maintenance system antidote protein VapI